MAGKELIIFFPLPWMKIADEGAGEHESRVWPSVGYCVWERGGGKRIWRVEKLGKETFPFQWWWERGPPQPSVGTQVKERQLFPPPSTRPESPFQAHLHVCCTGWCCSKQSLQMRDCTTKGSWKLKPTPSSLMISIIEAF